MPPSESNADTVRRYLRAIEETGDSADFYASDAIQVELPNRLAPNGATRDLAALKDAAARGKKVMQRQAFEVKKIISEGDTVVAEVLWTGYPSVAIGTLKPGDPMRAHFCMVIEFTDGKIVRQRNYDCFEPFSRSARNDTLPWKASRGRPGQKNGAAAGLSGRVSPLLQSRLTRWKSLVIKVVSATWVRASTAETLALDRCCSTSLHSKRSQAGISNVVMSAQVKRTPSRA